MRFVVASRNDTRPRRAQCAALAAGLVAVAALVGPGCGRHLYGRDELDVSLAQHHIDLRWGRLENAAQRVAPDLRVAFLQAWAARLRDVELQDIEIAAVVLSPDGDTADVVVVVTWVERATMQVRTAQVPERWQRTDDGWRATLTATLP